ncbi:hypothetical protein [Erythrobacter sp. F6033]|uniref:hypothetical protein n=1 Tax=Erythrobacter sp. F6033 TaxID=2926401 RepID=UPI001FF3CC52|nr:hypothetical protein [Erythrobacter sp. F6033]MCK0127977.1 hypothetical protein [Erythrobacter sp. F6033]
MMRSAAVLLCIASPAAAGDTFNCPEPSGDVKIDEAKLFRAYPSHVDRLLPGTLDVDYSCRIDQNGKFIDCQFAARQPLSITQERMLQRIMPRVMLAVTTDVRDQSCVASKISFTFGKEADASKPSPDEAAAERVVPD